MAQSGCMGEGPSELSRKRDTARRGYLTATKQYLSSRSARQMVCRDGKAAMWRQFLHGAICHDFVMGFQRREDMEKVLKVIAKRFAKYGLKVNEEKTRKVRFKRPLRYGKDPLGKPGTFDFLGFTIYWGKKRRGINIPKV